MNKGQLPVILYIAHILWQMGSVIAIAIICVDSRNELIPWIVGLLAFFLLFIYSIKRVHSKKPYFIEGVH